MQNISWIFVILGLLDKMNNIHIWGNVASIFGMQPYTYLLYNKNCRFWMQNSCSWTQVKFFTYLIQFMWIKYCSFKPRDTSKRHFNKAASEIRAIKFWDGTAVVKTSFRLIYQRINLRYVAWDFPPFVKFIKSNLTDFINLLTL